MLDQDFDLQYKQHMESTVVTSVCEKKTDTACTIYSAENENSVDVTQFSDIAQCLFILRQSVTEDYGSRTAWTGWKFSPV